MSKYGKKLNKSLHDEDNVAMEFILLWNAVAITGLLLLGIFSMLTAGK